MSGSFLFEHDGRWPPPGFPNQNSLPYDLNINSHGPGPFSVFSHGLCCFISSIDVFLMTARES